MASLTFLDLFSGAGGMSLGFHAHPAYTVVGAFDGEFGKPSSGPGSLGCNETYRLNMGVAPTALDLSTVTPEELAAVARDALQGRELDVLSACPPCTGFSRANPKNHLDDDSRNNLVVRTALWVKALSPRVIVMENARELVNGNFSHHFRTLSRELDGLGYDVRAEVHMLDRFGLPQRRERALVVAAKRPLVARTLHDLWAGMAVRHEAVTVRRAIAHLPAVAAGEPSSGDPVHVAPGMNDGSVERLRAVPHDGGSWIDIRHHRDADRLLTPAMKRYIEAEDFGSHPDVYGRMSWDRPAVTIKRECSHIGNGRYSHPEQDRLCTVREMGLLQGFPSTFQFGNKSLSNMYRHIGDAVPPLVSHQIAWVAAWILTGVRPDLAACVLPNTSLAAKDIVAAHLVVAKMPTRRVRQMEMFAISPA